MAIPKTGLIEKWWYGWTTEALERCLSDNITDWVKEERYKCPNPSPQAGYLLIAPQVYVQEVPSNLVSPEGVFNPPIVPSIVIEAHAGEVELHPLGEYLVSVRLMISLWDDAPDFSGTLDCRHLTEMLYLKLLRYRVLADRYELTGKPTWKKVVSGRDPYFIRSIDLEYNMGAAPDQSDNVDADLMLYSNTGSHIPTITDPVHQWPVDS
jgi:hypothetical protein